MQQKHEYWLLRLNKYVPVHTHKCPNRSIVKAIIQTISKPFIALMIFDFWNDFVHEIRFALNWPFTVYLTHCGLVMLNGISELGHGFVQVMACHLFDARQLTEPLLMHYRWNHQQQTSVKIEWKYNDIHSRILIWKCCFHFAQAQYVKPIPYNNWDLPHLCRLPPCMNKVYPKNLCTCSCIAVLWCGFELVSFSDLGLPTCPWGNRAIVKYQWSKRCDYQFMVDSCGSLNEPHESTRNW